jgi:hypothetical protein
MTSLGKPQRSLPDVFISKAMIGCLKDAYPLVVSYVRLLLLLFIFKRANNKPWLMLHGMKFVIYELIFLIYN